MIPVVDMKAQYLEIKDELSEAVEAVLADGRFILGPNVRELEAEIADFCGTTDAVGVASGTDALHLALRALNIGPGDEVITTPFTFIATAEAISYVGADPVFVDIDPLTYNLDVTQIEATITPRTRALLPVHLYGQPADMDAIMALAQKHSLAVVEDCAQAIGAEFGGKKVGAIGTIGCLSFFPSKNLGGAGDGGMIVTGDKQIAGRVKQLRAHGSSRKYYHEEIGYNSRLDEIQAAIVRVKLRRLPQWTEARQSLAKIYNENLADIPGIAIPKTAPGRTHVFHQYTIRLEDRDQVRAKLREAEIDSAVHYPLPIHLQPAYKNLKIPQGAYPQSERAAMEVLSIPMHPHLNASDARQVASRLIEAVERVRTGSQYAGE